MVLELVVLFASLLYLEPLAVSAPHRPIMPSFNNRTGGEEVLTGSLAKVHEDLVTHLPGQPVVGFRHYAGYVTVNQQQGRALFYWFFEASSHPDQKPLVLWLNGGPGCSSVGYGATQEIGPFLVDSNGRQLKFNPFSWNKGRYNGPILWAQMKYVGGAKINSFSAIVLKFVHAINTPEANLLFLESPVGVGFSYTNTSTDFDNIGDEFTANDAYEFLQNWFLKFPTYQGHAFYIAGESYAGKYVPELAELIHDRNQNSSFYIQLKGLLMGNPETSDPDDWRGLVDYAWSHAVVSDETHKIIKKTCDFDSNDTWSNPNCSQGVDEVLRQYKEIDIYSLYTSVCMPNSTSNSSMEVMFKANSKMMPRIMGGYDPCLDDYAKKFYNRPDVQKALHASDGLVLRNWSICNLTIFGNWSDSKPTVLPIYKKLINAGLRIWVYSGDTDGRVPVLSTRYSLNALGLPITKSWRPWYHEKQVSGWYQEYKGLTFATFRGAGHAVPIFTPSSSLALFSYFLRGESLPSSR